jgi:hypothetical protein
MNKKQKKSNELRLIRPHTQHKNPAQKYLKFLTTLTPPVEKIVIYMGSSKFIKKKKKK